jgi:hypothetical protein
VRPGSHAAGDGSFGRSAGIHVGKAVALVAIALAIGFVLLHRPPASVGVSPSGATATTVKAKKGSTATTTTPPPASSPTTQPARPPTNVKVLVANGTTVGGQAGSYSNKLHGDGYDTLASTNTFASARPPASIIYYAPNFQVEAEVLAQLLGLQASAVKPMPAQLPVASLQGANILVVIGPDLAKPGTTHQTTSTTKH